MRFFFDNCLSPKLARAIHALVEPDHEVVPLRDIFPPSTPDTDWIGTLASEGDWIIVTSDHRIRSRPLERQVWRTAKLTTFFMAEAFEQIPAWEQVRWMVDKWPLIVEQAERVTGGAAFRVPKRGKKLESRG